MGTLHRFAEAAIRRDLQRTRAVLVGGARLEPERRRALVEHLLWLVSLVDPTRNDIVVAGHRVAATLVAFHAEPDRQRRDEAITALDALLRVTRDAGTWTSSGEVRRLGDHVPWLLDGIAMPPGRGLVVGDQGTPEERRTRAAAYRRTRVLLWGTVALAPQRTMVVSAVAR